MDGQGDWFLETPRIGSADTAEMSICGWKYISESVKDIPVSRTRYLWDVSFGDGGSALPICLTVVGTRKVVTLQQGETSFLSGTGTLEQEHQLLA